MNSMNLEKLTGANAVGGAITILADKFWLLELADVDKVVVAIGIGTVVAFAVNLFNYAIGREEKVTS